MVQPDFEIKAPNYVQDRSTGIEVRVLSTVDYFSYDVRYRDKRFATEISFPAGALARAPSGGAAKDLSGDGPLCGYDVNSGGVARLGDYPKKSNVSVEDVETYLREGLAIIASNTMPTSKEDAIIRVKVRA